MKRLMIVVLSIAAFSCFAAEPPAKPAGAATSAPPKPTADACKLPPKTTVFTFWQSCKNVTLNGCTLQASCQTASQTWRNTTFDMSQFPNCYDAPIDGRNLSNNNGTLCCGYAGTPQICGT
ncbi:MAG: hypothetical protein E6K53_11650 [Gammaproteobacteria bacterium]|nr:MAG: hypothetical protein E6K53_11650 [Gammaproteobacteria bacterium]